MPSINMPGKTASPLEGLATIVSTISNLKKNSSETDLNAQKTQADKLSNQQVEMQNSNSQKYLQALSDPISNESQSEKAAGGSYLAALRSTNMYAKNPKTGEDALTPLENAIQDPKTSGLQVQQAFNSPVFKSITGLGEAKMKGEGSMVLAGIRGEGVANQKDRIAASAGDHFDKDPILTKISKQKQQVDLDKHTLETAPVLTPQIINEIQQGIANAISGGGSAGLGKTEQTEIHTAKQKIAELQQRFSSNPTPVNDPQLVEYFHGVLGRLGDAYDRNGYSRAQQIFKGRAQGYKSNPAAVQVMQDKVESYRPSDPISTNSSSGPKVGEIDSGHKFLGGDPANPKSWEIVK